MLPVVSIKRKIYVRRAKHSWLRPELQKGVKKANRSDYNQPWKYNFIYGSDF